MELSDTYCHNSYLKAVQQAHTLQICSLTLAALCCWHSVSIVLKLLLSCDLASITTCYLQGLHLGQQGPPLAEAGPLGGLHRPLFGKAAARPGHAVKQETTPSQQHTTVSSSSQVWPAWHTSLLCLCTRFELLSTGWYKTVLPLSVLFTLLNVI